MHKSNPTFLRKHSTQLDKVRMSKITKKQNKKKQQQHKSRKINKEKEKVSLHEKNFDLSNSLWMAITAPRWGSEMRETKERKELQDGGVKEPADSLGGKRKSGLVYLRDS